MVVGEDAEVAGDGPDDGAGFDGDLGVALAGEFYDEDVFVVGGFAQDGEFDFDGGAGAMDPFHAGLGAVALRWGFEGDIDFVGAGVGGDFAGGGGIGEGGEGGAIGEVGLAVVDAAVENVDVAEEGEDEGVGGFVVDFFRGTDLFHTAAVHDEDAVGDFEGFFLIVGDKEAGDVDFIMEFAEPAAEFFADLGIEGTEGFIEEEDFGAGGQGAGEGDALALAAGELGGVAFFHAAELDEVEEFIDAVGDFPGGVFADAEAEGDVFEDGHVLEEGVMLEDEADVAVAGGAFGGVFAFENDGTLVGGFEAGDDAEEGGFAGAGGTEEGDEFAGGGFDGDVIEGFEGAEGFGDVLDEDAHR